MRDESPYHRPPERKSAMPEEFDPAWEYRVDNPEIEEVMSGNSVDKMTSLISEVSVKDSRSIGRCHTEGIRFGRGSPDCGNPFHLKHEKVLIREYLEDKWCQQCGIRFHPKRKDSRYCSMKCYVHPGRPRTLLDRQCLQCGGVFRPRHHDSKFCGRTCFSLSCRRENRVKQPMTHFSLLGGTSGQERFSQMYLAGDRVSDIAAEFGIQSILTVKRIRARLGLPPRPPGNLTKKRRQQCQTTSVSA